MYFLSKRSYSSLRNMVTEDPDTVVPILFDRMPALAKNFLPMSDSDNPFCLLNEQYIVKSPKTLNSSFDWHQDSQYMDESAQKEFPVLACWTALDDVNLSNGTLLIEPFPRPLDSLTGEQLDPPKGLDDPKTFLRYQRALAATYGSVNEKPNMETILKNAVRVPSSVLRPESTTTTVMTETAASESTMEVDYKTSESRPTMNLNDPNSWTAEPRNHMLVEIPKGSVVFMSGFLRHCSLGNQSSKFRRAYMPQYSVGKVKAEEGNYVSLAVPCFDEQGH
ncbi:hypothetical protein BGZ83_009680 [Gryganskiella cystojenkinii]|nr:hypothetical protein BGZ83_009680 [Gryganskiella cystojenkinii]